MTFPLDMRPSVKGQHTHLCLQTPLQARVEKLSTKQYCVTTSHCDHEEMTKGQGEDTPYKLHSKQVGKLSTRQYL